MGDYTPAVGSLQEGFLYSDGVLTDLGTPTGLSGFRSGATGINDAGVICGDAYGEGYVYQNGAFTGITSLSEALGINSLGEVVGNVNEQGGIYLNGTTTLLDNSAPNTSGEAINDLGQVAGEKGGVAALLTTDSVTSLGTLPAPYNTYSLGTAINSSGEVVGYSQSSDTDADAHAFSYANGVMTDLGTVGGAEQSEATGINDSGQIVGDLANGYQSGFIYENGTMTDLQTLIPADPGWSITFIDGINNNGQIVGTAQDPEGNNDAILLTPVSTSHLAFAQQPTAAKVGAAISPAITVDIEDATITWTANNAGTTEIHFVYNGDSNYTTSTSNSLSQTYLPLSQLAANIKGAVIPSTSVAGQPYKAKLPSKFTNEGSALTGTYTVVLYADTSSNGFTGNQIALQTVPKHETLKAGKFFAVTLTTKNLPATLSAGTYYLLVEITDPDGNKNLVNTSQTIAVAAPYIALSASASAVKPSDVAVKKSGSITITVEDTGNIAAVGTLNITLSPSPDGISALTGTTLVTMPPRKVTLKVLKPGQYVLKFKISALLAPGSYYTIAAISLDGVSATAIGSPFTAG